VERPRFFTLLKGKGAIGFIYPTSLPETGSSTFGPLLLSRILILASSKLFLERLIVLVTSSMPINTLPSSPRSPFLDGSRLLSLR